MRLRLVLSQHPTAILLDPILVRGERSDRKMIDLEVRSLGAHPKTAFPAQGGLHFPTARVLLSGAW